MLRSAWFIARKDVGYMLRQKETILWVFLMPILFFYFIGTVTGGFGPSGSEDEPDRLALIASADDDLLVDQLVRRLERENFVVERRLSRADEEAHSRRLTIPEPADGSSSFTESGDLRPGLHASCLKFIKDSDCCVLVWDMMDHTPNGYGLPWSVHGSIFAYGIGLLDNSLLQPLAEACAEENRYEFMLTINPLHVVGGTGSPVNPVALF